MGGQFIDFSSDLPPTITSAIPSNYKHSKSLFLVVFLYVLFWVILTPPCIGAVNTLNEVEWLYAYNMILFWLTITKTNRKKTMEMCIQGAEQNSSIMTL
jgi:hypothetical protein